MYIKNSKDKLVGKYIYIYVYMSKIKFEFKFGKNMLFPHTFFFAANLRAVAAFVFFFSFFVDALIFLTASSPESKPEDRTALSSLANA